MAELESQWTQRIARVCGEVGRVTVSGRLATQPIGCLVAATSSRLGHDPSLHRSVCQFLCQSLLDCRHRGATLLIASGSAIQPWAVRAAELFAVPLMILSVDANDAGADIVVISDQRQKLSRDAVAIAIADRVDAVHVRRGGTIHRCLQRRVEYLRDASTRVAVSSAPTCAAPALIKTGAIGWLITRAADDTAESPAIQPLAGGKACEVGNINRSANFLSPQDDWMRTEGRWLIHCTRGRNEPWPGETWRQFRDGVILGNDVATTRKPLDALCRILRGGRILAAATATARQYPVVCFSALSLQELLQRRCFRPQLGRWDYEPYGIAISMPVARRLGIQPVLYGNPDDRAALSPDQRFRFHPVGKTFDWREEREWRSSQSVDLQQIDRDEIRVFAEDSPQARRRLGGCKWPVTFTTPQPQHRRVTIPSQGKQV